MQDINNVQEIIRTSNIIKLMKESAEKELGYPIKIEADDTKKATNDTGVRTADEQIKDNTPKYRTIKLNTNDINFFKSSESITNTKHKQISKTIALVAKELGKEIVNKSSHDPVSLRNIEAVGAEEGIRLLKTAQNKYPQIVPEAIGSLKLYASENQVTQRGPADPYASVALPQRGPVDPGATTELPQRGPAKPFASAEPPQRGPADPFAGSNSPNTTIHLNNPAIPDVIQHEQQPPAVDIPQRGPVSEADIKAMSEMSLDAEPRSITVLPEFHSVENQMVTALDIDKRIAQERGQILSSGNIKNIEKGHDRYRDYQRILYDKHMSIFQKMRAIKRFSKFDTITSNPMIEEHFEYKQGELDHARVTETDFRKRLNQMQEEHLNYLSKMNMEIMQLSDLGSSRETAKKSQLVIKGMVDFANMKRTADERQLAIDRQNIKLTVAAKQMTEQSLANQVEYASQNNQLLLMDEPITEDFKKEMSQLSAEEIQEFAERKHELLKQARLTKQITGDMVDQFGKLVELYGSQDKSFRQMLVGALDKHGLLGAEGAFNEYELFKGRIDNILNPHDNHEQIELTETTTRKRKTTNAEYIDPVISEIETGLRQDYMSTSEIDALVDKINSQFTTEDAIPDQHTEKQPSKQGYREIFSEAFDEIDYGEYIEEQRTDSNVKKRKHIQEKANDQILEDSRHAITYGTDEQVTQYGKDVRKAKNLQESGTTPRERAQLLHNTNPRVLLNGQMVEDVAKHINSSKLTDMGKVLNKFTKYRSALEINELSKEAILQAQHNIRGENISYELQRFKKTKPSMSAVMSININANMMRGKSSDTIKRMIRSIQSKANRTGYESAISPVDLETGKRGERLYVWNDPGKPVGESTIYRIKGKYQDMIFDSSNFNVRRDSANELRGILNQEELRIRNSIFTRSHYAGSIEHLTRVIGKGDAHAKSTAIKNIGIAVLAGLGMSEVVSSLYSGTPTNVQSLEKSMYFDGESFEAYSSNIKEQNVKNLILDVSGVKLADNMIRRRDIHIRSIDPAGQHNRARGAEAMAQYYRDFDNR